MKSFIGWLLIGAGAILAAWGGYCCMTGTSRAYMNPLPVNAMTGGLIGLVLLVVGFIWIRD